MPGVAVPAGGFVGVGGGVSLMILSLSMADKERIIEALVATGKWSKNHAEAAVRAGFRCEYCGLDFLRDPQHYKLWQLDHIVPRKLVTQEGGDPDGLENLAIACKPCNYDFKWRFDPRKTAGATADRSALIRAATEEIERRRQACDADLARVREIVGWTPEESSEERS